MRSTFENDPFPGRTKILFIGHPLSTHVFSWIDLLAHAQINVRFFALPAYPPPADWPVRTYLGLSDPPEDLDRDTRISIHPSPEQVREGVLNHQLYGTSYLQTWLADIVAYWRPHIVHVFGI